MLIPNGVQSCIKDLNAVNVQLLEATKAINQFNNTDLVELKVHKPITDIIQTGIVFSLRFLPMDIDARNGSFFGYICYTMFFKLSHYLKKTSLQQRWLEMTSRSILHDPQILTTDGLKALK
ncbi:hypothetical protein V8B55DRAFT_1409682 [Mucor lusitanicus]